MTLEDRVSRLEQRIDQLDRIAVRLESMDVGLRNVEAAVVGLRGDFTEFRSEQGAILGRILASIDDLRQRPIVFRWPWEPLSR